MPLSRGSLNEAESKGMRGFYFITDSKLSRKGIVSDVKSAISAGVKIVQYREKTKDSGEMYEEARVLRKLCGKITFLINDRIDIALAVGADGVHLGQEDLPCGIARRILGGDKIIGATAHSLKEALKAQAEGADYLGVSPIFATKTKPDAGAPKGIRLISRIKKDVSLPLVAVGGINLSNASEVIRSGADCVSAISAVLKSGNVRKEISKFQELFAIMPLHKEVSYEICKRR